MMLPLAQNLSHVLQTSKYGKLGMTWVSLRQVGDCVRGFWQQRTIEVGCISHSLRRGRKSWLNTTSWHAASLTSLLCDLHSPPSGTNAPSANVTVAFHEAYVGVVVMNQLNCHDILGSFRGKRQKENLWRKPRAGQCPLSPSKLSSQLIQEITSQRLLSWCVWCF